MSKKDDIKIYYLPDDPKALTESDVSDAIGSQMRAQNAGQMRLTSGTLQSANYVAGSTGWQLTPTSADLNLALTVDSIDIPDTTTANSFHVDVDGNMWIGATTFAAPAPFRVANTGDMDIGGTDATSFHVDAAGNMWLGASTFGSAPAKVSNAGAATFTSVTLSTNVAISGIANNTSTDISLIDCTHDLAFSASDNDTVAWGSGTITFSNGRTFSISAGNTGNMSALTYIYLDPGTSSTVLQTTTTATTAEGANKKLIAQAQNSASGINAIFLVQRGRSLNGTSGGVPVAISGSHISTLSVSGKSCTFDTGTIGGFTMSSTTLTATNFSVTSGAANTARVEVGTGSNIGGINSGNGASDIAFWAGSTHANRATAPFRVDMAGNLTATSATLSGYVVSTKGVFGGDGSDGALSGTTAIDLGSAAVVIKNYTSISLTGTQALTFTNPNSNGTTIILKSQGNVTITSTATRAIDLRNLGNVAGTGGAPNFAGNPGDDSPYIVDTATHGGGGGGTGGFVAPGTAGAAFTALSLYAYTEVNINGFRSYLAVPGSSGGGGGGGSTGSGAGGAAGGNGGRAAGSLIIECAGAYNCTGTIDASGTGGSNGSNESSGDTGGGGGGGGGGTGGMITVIYNSLTADSGTYTVTGGSGGGGGTGDGGQGGDGGGGGGFLANAGTAGSENSGVNGGAGGGGAVGVALRIQNKAFA